MTLQNLLRIGRLHAHAADRNAIRILLAAAGRNLADASAANISNDNRFDAAYKCLLQCATLGLWSAGFRTSTSQPGHHQTALQCLPLTMKVSTDELIVLDALRRQRNLSDYQGDPVPDAALDGCRAAAERLLAHTTQWLADWLVDG